MGCCHELRARVLKLETDLPNVEKSLQSEATLFRLIYSPGNMLDIITSLKVQKRIRDRSNNYSSKQQISICTCLLFSQLLATTNMADYCDFDCDIYMREREREREREIAPYPPCAYLCMHSVLLKMTLWSAMLFLTVCKTLAYFFVLASIKGFDYSRNP
jgi:hypothetical protein